MSASIQGLPCMQPVPPTWMAGTCRMRTAAAAWKGAKQAVSGARPGALGDSHGQLLAALSGQHMQLGGQARDSCLQQVLAD